METRQPLPRTRGGPSPACVGGLSFIPAKSVLIKGTPAPRALQELFCPATLTHHITHVQNAIDSTTFAFKSSTHPHRPACGVFSLEFQLCGFSAFSRGHAQGWALLPPRTLNRLLCLIQKTSSRAEKPCFF